MNAGIYYATIETAGVTPTKKGGLQVWIDVLVTHVADQTGNWTEIGHVQKTTFLSLSDAAMPYTREKLAGLEFNGDFGNVKFGKSQVEIECRYEMYEGKNRERWELPGQATRQAAQENDIRTLNAIWKQGAKSANTPAPSGRPSAPPSRVAAPVAAAVAAGGGAVDEDIPFAM